MYYLNSRYYNPEWGRFVNADAIVGQVGELLSHNMFAYCWNNPVNMEDRSGYWAVRVNRASLEFGGSSGVSLGTLTPSSRVMEPTTPYPSRNPIYTSRILVRDWRLMCLANNSKTVPKGMGTRIFGQNGTQVTSKTVWRTGMTERIDVENPNPGQRAGDIHYHDANNVKYRFNPSAGKFYDESGGLAPNKVQNLLNDRSFQKNIDKGLYILGEKPLYK